jgi:LAO/AO transport system kinase
VSGTGLAEVWEVIEKYAAATRQSGYFQQRRQQQQLQWLHQSIVQELESRFYADEAVRKRLPAVQQAVAAGRLTPFAAATALLNLPAGATTTP